MSKSYDKNKKGIFYILIVGIIGAIIYRISKIRQMSSVGIIGGSDGPTAIYLSGETKETIVLMIVIALIVIGLVVYKLFKRK